MNPQLTTPQESFQDLGNAKPKRSYRRHATKPLFRGSGSTFFSDFLETH